MNISSPMIGCLVAAAAAAVSVLGAAEVQLKAQRVSLFKNGYARVQMQGELPQGTQAEVKGLPLPLFGTLEWSVPEGVRVTHFEARKGDEQGMKSEMLLPLTSLVGKEVRVITASKREFSGVLVAPAQLQAKPQGAFCTEEYNSTMLPPPSQVVALRTAKGGLISLPVSSITGVELADPAEVSAPRPAAAELSVGLAAPAAGSPLGVSLVARGLSWLPTYRLELQESGQAHLVCNVSVINSLLDLEGVELELITGHPALGEGLVTSPLVRLVGLSTFLRALERNRDWVGDAFERERKMHDTYRSRALAGADAVWVDSESDDDDDDAVAMECAPVVHAAMSSGGYGGITGGVTTRAEDLTYYTIPSFSCKRGEVVECELFDITVPCRHVYTCDLPDQRVLQSAARNERNVADVWHCVRLTNSGKLPWSMGVVSCHSGGRFAARAALPFTAVGQESLLRLSKTMETAITCREELVENGVRRPDGKSSPDVYRGQILLINHSDQPIELELTKAVYGTPTEASDAGQISVTPAYSGNPHAVVTWKLRLEPRREKTCTYTYQFLND